MTSLQRIVAFVSVPLLLGGCPTRTIYYDAGTDVGREGGNAGSAGQGNAGTTGGLGGSGERSAGNGGGGLGTGGSGGAAAPGGSAGGAAGAGGSPSIGTGGSGVICQPDAKRCAADGVETCLTNGTWGPGVPCGAHQSCVTTGLSAQCLCSPDAVCTGVGKSCTSAGLLASCSQDGNGCFYETSADSCPDGACTGALGAASCCTNACSNGAAQCTSANSIQTCGPLANGCTGWTTSACAAGTVCERGAQASCLDPDWAEWPVPNDLNSYLAGAPNLQAYVDDHDGSVLDSVTGLIWEKAVPGTTYDLTSARAYCSSLTLAGHQDWRLPSSIELVSLVDYGAINFNSGTAAIDGTAFPSTPADSFISSTIWAASSAPVSVSFANGQLSFVSGPGYVRCVR